MCVCVGGGGGESTGPVGTTMGGEVRGTGDEKGVLL